MSRSATRFSRRTLIAGAVAGLGIVGLGITFRRKILRFLAQKTRLASFSAPPSPASYSGDERSTIHVGRSGSPAQNMDTVLDSLGGPDAIIGKDDVVIIKVNAQWWNQGMTNVASVKRLLERLLERSDFTGEIIVFENSHFRLEDGSGLSRAFTRPSDRNVDVPGWTRLGDLMEWEPAKNGPVSFVGLIDAGESALSGEIWRDPGREHGVYGGDGRGPIPAGDPRDGYHWDLDAAFSLKRSWFDSAASPLTWPRFTSPRSGLVVDLRDGVLRREGNRLVPTDRKLTWIVMSGANEHSATGVTGACKSLMGLVDMSAGRLGTHPDIQDFEAVHYFGAPDAMWRMAGPLADFTQRVRAPDLYIAAVEWAGVTPAGGLQGDDDDPRLHERAAVHARTVVAGTDPVAVDAWCVRNILMPVAGERYAAYNLDDPASTVSCFLGYWREVSGKGVLDTDRIDVRVA